MQEDRLLASCVVVVPAGAASPLGKHEEVSWQEVMEHIAKRLRNVNPGFQIKVYTDDRLEVCD